MIFQEEYFYTYIHSNKGFPFFRSCGPTHLTIKYHQWYTSHWLRSTALLHTNISLYTLPLFVGELIISVHFRAYMLD